MRADPLQDYLLARDPLAAAQPAGEAALQRAIYERVIGASRGEARERKLPRRRLSSRLPVALTPLLLAGLAFARGQHSHARRRCSRRAVHGWKSQA
jgi:hypothetical protein